MAKSFQPFTRGDLGTASAGHERPPFLLSGLRCVEVTQWTELAANHPRHSDGKRPLLTCAGQPINLRYPGETPQFGQHGIILAAKIQCANSAARKSDGRAELGVGSEQVCEFVGHVMYCGNG
jgi:hypothetical protein